jgi:hypothetical protein
MVVKEPGNEDAPCRRKPERSGRCRLGSLRASRASSVVVSRTRMGKKERERVEGKQEEGRRCRREEHDFALRLQDAFI